MGEIGNFEVTKRDLITGKRLIHFYSSNKNVRFEIIKSLVDKKADVGVMDNKENLAHHYLCQNENVNLEILSLIKERFLFSKANNEDKTGLHFLSLNPKINLEMLKFCFHDEIKLKELVEGTSILHNLCLNKTEQPLTPLFSFLLSKKGDPNLKNEESKTVLHLLFEKKELEVETLKELLENKADLNLTDTKGKTCFHNFSPEKNFKEGLDLLIKHKANLNLRDKNGNSFFHHFFTQKNLSMDNYEKIEGMIDLNSVNENDENILHLYLKQEKIDKKILALLLDKKCDQPNAQNKKGETILLLLFSIDQEDLLDLIEKQIEKGGEVNVCDKSGNSCFSYSLKDEKKIHFLEKKCKNHIFISSSSPSSSSSDLPPLFYQLFSFDSEKILSLLSFGAHLNFFHPLHSYPLHFYLSLDSINYENFLFLVSNLKGKFILILFIFFILIYFYFCFNLILN